jgi:hypothetical protein
LRQRSSDVGAGSPHSPIASESVPHPRIVGVATAEKAAEGSEPYKVFMPKKTQKMVYSKGKPVYKLVDPDGNVYVLQAHEARFPIKSLAELGEQPKQLPKGLAIPYPDADRGPGLDLKADQTICALGDEYHQYWTRISTSK